MAYVKLEDVLNIIKEQNCNNTGVIQHIKQHCPTADVVEVKHGEWLYSRVHNILHCSECGEIPDCFEPPYCPNCGADMRGETDAKL